MPGENTLPQSAIAYFGDQINHIFQIYKIPIILSLIGFLFLIAAAVSLIGSSMKKSEIVFSSATDSGQMTITVEIAGAVLLPDVYTMEEGSRINDLLVKAGGLSAYADRGWVEKSVNKAAKLTDGSKIYIPKSGEISSGKSSSLSNLTSQSNLLGIVSQKVNINSASQTDLEKLPGVGPVTAAKIISGRPYQSAEDLKSKKIVGNALFDKIKDLITPF